MDILIRECNIEEINFLLRLAKKEGVITTLGKSKTKIFCAEFEGDIIAFCKLVYLRPKRVRLGGLFVIQKFRRNRIGFKLVEYRLGLLDKDTMVDVYTYWPTLFEKFGFEVIKTYSSSNGKTFYMVKKNDFTPGKSKI